MDKEELMGAFKNQQFKDRIRNIQHALDVMSFEFGINFTLLLTNKYDGDDSGIYQSEDCTNEDVKKHIDMCKTELNSRIYIEQLLEQGFELAYCIDCSVFNQINKGTHYIVNKRFKIQDEWFLMLEGLGERLFPISLFSVLRKQQILS